MSISLPSRRVRLLVDVTSPQNILDFETGQPPIIPKGGDVQFDLGFFFGLEGGPPTDDKAVNMTGYESITVVVRYFPAASVNLMAQSTSSITATITAAGWTAVSSQHCSVSFTATEANIAVGDYRLGITGITAGGKEVPLGQTKLSIQDFGVNTDADPPPLNPGSAISLAEADARYQPLNGNLMYPGGAHILAPSTGTQLNYPSGNVLAMGEQLFYGSGDALTDQNEQVLFATGEVALGNDGKLHGDGSQITGYNNNQLKNLASIAPTYIVFEGDSLTQGYSGTTPFSTYLAALPAAQGVTVTNVAVSGATIPTGSTGGNNIVDHYAANVHPHRSTAHGGDGGTRPVLFLMIGTNDLGTLGRTDAQVISDRSAYIANAQSEGFIVMDALLSCRNDGLWSAAKEAYRISVNQSTAQGLTSANYVWDPGHICEQTGNTSWFQTDQLHWKNPFNAAVAQYLNRGIFSGGFDCELNPRSNVAPNIPITAANINTSDQAFASGSEIAIDFRSAYFADNGTTREPYFPLPAGTYLIGFFGEMDAADWQLLLRGVNGGTLSGSNPSTISGGSDTIRGTYRGSNSGITVSTQNFGFLMVVVSAGDVMYISAKQSSGSTKNFYHNAPGTGIVAIRIRN